MPSNLQRVLGGRNLTGLIQGVRPGLPKDRLPPGLDGSKFVRRVEGDYATYVRVEGTKKTARRVAGLDAPAAMRVASGISEVPVKLIVSKEEMGLKAADLINLESPDGDRQRLGETEVARIVAEARDYQDNLRTACLFSCFSPTTAGKIYFDANGNLLPSSSGATVTIDPGIPAGNLNQVSSSISASWATSTTKIVSDIQKIKAHARKVSEYPIRHAIYGSSVIDYLLTNAQVKEYLVRFPSTQEQLASGEITKLWGMTWWPAAEWYFQDDNGTNQAMFPEDGIAFLPEPEASWFEILEGTSPVPSQITINADLSAAMQSIKLVVGRYAYSTITMNPVGGTMFYGDNFLPVIKAPKAVILADVVP